jgi:Ca2+-binding RTX toxin-like protein
MNNHQDSLERRLYVNQGNGTFRDWTQRYFGTTEIRGDFHGAVWLDIDNDGDEDLIQLAGARGASATRPNPNYYEHLYINENGRLIDRTTGFWGIGYALGAGRTPLQLDLNRDGKLDILYTAKPRNDGLFPTTIFQQTQNDFINLGAQLGITTNLEGEVFPIRSDITGDGYPELILNTKSRTNQLVVYDTRTRPFTDITSRVFGALTFPDKVKDIATGDFNSDGKIDAYILTRSSRDYLLVNKNGKLVDVSTQAGIAGQKTLGKTVVSGDWDNDGDLDLFIVQSGKDRADGAPTNTPDLILENNGTGKFTRLAEAGGAFGTNLGIGDSVTVVDYDNDGNLDLFVSNGDLSDAQFPGYDNGPYQLFRNQGTSNHWLEVDLQGVQTNRDGVGSTVLAIAGGKTQIRERMGGIHARSQNHSRLHFGLGRNALVTRVEVNWDSGLQQVHFNQAADQILTLVEGVGLNGVDKLTGTQRGDSLLGLDGADRLFGMGGNDTLIGGLGADKLMGGPGQDQFVYNRRLDGGDRILDFSVQDDVIVLRRQDFDPSLARGTLADEAFVIGSAARDRSDRVIYNDRTGALLFDDDGSGTGRAIALAGLTPGLNLSAADIRVF